MAEQKIKEVDGQLGNSFRNFTISSSAKTQGEILDLVAWKHPKSTVEFFPKLLESMSKELTSLGYKISKKVSETKQGPTVRFVIEDKAPTEVV